MIYEVNKSSIHTSSAITQLQRQELLLRMEYEYEKESFKQQTEAMGIGRKIKHPGGPGWQAVLHPGDKGTGRL